MAQRRLRRRRRLYNRKPQYEHHPPHINLDIDTNAKVTNKISVGIIISSTVEMKGRLDTYDYISILK